jgi:hypothetical protein
LIMSVVQTSLRIISSDGDASPPTSPRPDEQGSCTDRRRRASTRRSSTCSSTRRAETCATSTPATTRRRAARARGAVHRGHGARDFFSPSAGSFPSACLSPARRSACRGSGFPA